ncbi:MAG: choice-of-anchor Q domain-containing protein [Dehalococcoidia bacterium]
MLARSLVTVAVLALCVIAPLPAGPAGASQALNVTKTADAADGVCDADCSLREAVIAANANPDTNTINVPSGTYVLTIPGDHEEEAAQDDLDLNEDVTIVGAGTDTPLGASGVGATIIDGNDQTRIFDVVPEDIVVAMSNMTLRNGLSPTVGGAIDNHAELTLTDVAITGNDAPIGGGISNRGDLTLERVTISGNTAMGNGGGIRNEATGTLTVRDSTISENSAAEAFAEGGGIANAGAAMLDGVLVEDNESEDSGGGIQNAFGGQLTVLNSVIDSNESLTSASGAIQNNGEVTIFDSMVSNNTSANEGGAMRSNGSLTIEDSTFSGNTAGTRAGAVLAAYLQVKNSTFSGNAAMDGDGGGIQIDGALALQNVTITGNSASSGGGGLAFEGAVAAIANTIIAGNVGDDCQIGDPLTSLGYNLDGDGTCGFAAGGDLPNTDPQLGPLADNGGPTLTHALLAGSPAIDAAGQANCPEEDQRGVLRGIDCDIGAFEYVALAGDQRTWGDDNCSGAPDPVDSLLTLRFDGGLSADTGECPPMGDVVEVANASPHPWGDVDCSGAVNPVDSLKLLRFDAGLSVAQPVGCPEMGADVLVVTG